MEKDYYVMQMLDLVEAELTGPFDNKENVEEALDSLKEIHGDFNHSYHILSVTKGAQIEVG